MSELETIKLGDLLSEPPAYGANASAQLPNGIDPRYLRITDIDESGHLLFDDIKSIPRLVGGPYLLKQNDLVIARTGNTVGKSYLHNETNGPLAYAGYLVRFRLDEQKADPTFVFHYLHSPAYWQWIGNTLRTGAQPNVNAAEYKQLTLPAFSCPQQRKIARILTTLDNLIEKTESLIAKYQSIKQGMMADLFTRGVDANGKLRPPQSAAPELYKQSELGWIPKEWEVSTLDAAAERVIVGLALSVTQAYGDSGTPLIRNQNIRSGFFEDDEMLFLDPQFAALFPNKRLIEGDVLTVRTGANVGDTALVPAKYCGCLTFTTLITTPKRSVLFAPFMVAYLASSSGLSELNRLLVGGGKENLNVGEFIKLRIPLPDVSEQQGCISSMTSVTTAIETERAVVRNLREIKTGLIQDLLTGKVPVTPDESEEITP